MTSEAEEPFINDICQAAKQNDIWVSVGLHGKVGTTALNKYGPFWARKFSQLSPNRAILDSLQKPAFIIATFWFLRKVKLKLIIGRSISLMLISRVEPG